MLRRRSMHAALMVAALVPMMVSAGDWPAWRGANSSGVAPDGTYPVNFSKTEGLRWRVDLPGRGCSTPVVWKDQLWLTSVDEGENVLMCYSLKGKALWSRRLGKATAGSNQRGTGANPSPVTDGKHVVAYFKSGTVACFDISGKALWTVELSKGYPEGSLQWDVGSSPLIYKETVIITVLQTGSSFLVAFDLESGEERWRVDRPFTVPTENNEAYCTPVLARPGGRETIVVWGADHLTGHDPTNGKQLWVCDGFNPREQRNWRVIASVAVDGDYVLVPYARGKYLAGVKLEAKGDSVVPTLVWERKGVSADTPTPAVRDGIAYVLSDRGVLDAVNMTDGSVLHSLTLPDVKGKFFASPLLAGDTIYCAADDGTVFIVKVSDDGLIHLRSNRMEDVLVASPVPVEGGLLLRSMKALYCIGN